VRAARQLELDQVARRDLTPGHDNAHHAGLSEERSIGATLEHGRKQAALKAIELRARIPETRQLHHGVGTEPEAGANWQLE
jgi:hypothetical protein